MAKIFISHSGLDQKFAEDLASELRKYDHEPTGDVGLTVTPNWDTELLQALSKSDVVVFLFTQNAAGSEYILGEVGSAKVLYNLRQRPHLIPVVFPGGLLPKPLSQVWAQTYPAVPTAAELGAGINALIARLPKDSRTALGNDFVSDKITLRWLWDHVPVKVWLILAGALIGMFTAGFGVGQNPKAAEFVRSLFGKEAPPAAVREAPKTGDASTSGQQSPAVTGSGNDIQYNQAPPPKEKPKTSK